MLTTSPACAGIPSMVRVGVGTIATLSGSVRRADSTVAMGRAKTDATTPLPFGLSLSSCSRCNHASNNGSRSAGGNASTAFNASPILTFTSSISSGSAGRPAASSRANSSTRRSTWPMCQVAGSPKVFATTPCTPSLPRLTG